MKKILSLIIIIFSFYSKLNAQTKMNNPLKFPESFELAEYSKLKEFQLVSVKKLTEYGIEINEHLGLITKKESMEPFIRDFDGEEINQLYFQIYTYKGNKDQEAFSVVVFEFNSDLDLKKNLLLVDEAGLFIPVYFITNNYLISISCEDRALLKTISLFYTQQVGAVFYQPKRN